MNNLNALNQTLLTLSPPPSSAAVIQLARTLAEVLDLEPTAALVREYRAVLAHLYMSTETPTDMFEDLISSLSDNG